MDLSKMRDEDLIEVVKKLSKVSSSMVRLLMKYCGFVGVLEEY